MDHILIVSQSPEAIAALIPRNCSSASAETGTVPDLIVLDHPDAEQVHACQKSWPGKPLVLIVEPSSEAHLEGCAGSIISPPLVDTLVPALRCWLPGLSTRHLLEANSLARLYQMGGRALADRILDGFFVDGPRSLALCLEEWKAGRAESTVHALRELHERAGRVGATTLQDLSAQLEERIHRGDGPGELTPVWAQLQGTMQAVTRMLEQQRRQERTA